LLPYGRLTLQNTIPFIRRRSIKDDGRKGGTAGGCSSFFVSRNTDCITFLLIL
jgi:hypothetical protein